MLSVHLTTITTLLAAKDKRTLIEFNFPTGALIQASECHDFHQVSRSYASERIMTDLIQ